MAARLRGAVVTAAHTPIAQTARRGRRQIAASTPARQDADCLDHFYGFDKKDEPTLHAMGALLRRNQFLSLCEGAAALALLLTQQHSSMLDVSERALYTVQCVTNAYFLRCAGSKYNAGVDSDGRGFSFVGRRRQHLR
jgi:hypothetical protein